VNQGWLEERAVRLGVSARDWQEAVRIAGQRLVDLGLADERYPEAMVRCVHEFGPYIVVAPGVAVAHARPEEGGLKDGIVLVRLDPSLPFGHADNDPVTFLFAFSARESGHHLEMLKDLAVLLADQEAMAALNAATTPGEAVRAVQSVRGT